ncbi:phage protein Gp36 family protein [Caenispirillum bisanense]|uniref:Mu-like prophage protein gp36 n=1 Tax=Caenispirillum bisanense TaxID=414052 RepID=A0A286GYW0_9PROT|nr:phage protein Gp36 family protein [Caenispirillum bisanense]SOE00671.1 Mu-like prophage protein gp36 [Caenispirillum bisanense]
MAYATLADLIDRFGADELDDLARPHQVPEGETAPAFAAALAAADAEIDAALAGRYAVPVPEPVPTLLVDIACDIARWRLHDTSADEMVTERARVARAQLRMLALGQLTLPLPAAAGGGAGVGPRHVAAPVVFTPDSLRGL